MTDISGSPPYQWRPTAPTAFVPPPVAAPHPDSHRHTDTRSTRHLCAGTYLDPEFRDTVLSRIYYRPDRAIAAAAGADTAAVVSHALRARLLAVSQAGCLLVLLLASVVATLQGDGTLLAVLFPYLLIQGIISQGRLIRDIIALAQRKSGDWRPVLGRTLGLSGGYLLIGLLVPVLDDLFETGSLRSATQDGLISSTGLAFLFLMVVTVTAFAVARRYHVNRLARGSGAVGHDDTRPLVRWIRHAQYGDVANYAGYDPFAHLGVRLRDWRFALPLRPLPGPTRAGWPHFDTVMLTEHVRRELSNLARSTTSSTRLPGLQLTDQAVVSGLETVAPTHFTVDLARSHQLSDMDSIRRDPTTVVRHFLKCEISSWDGEIVTTVHVHAAMQGETLYMAFHSFALPPTKAEYHVLGDRAGDTFQVFQDIGRSLVRLPALLAGAPGLLWRAATEPVRAAMRSATDPTTVPGTVDHGSHHSVRTLGTDLDVHQYFQYHDALKYTSILEAQLLDAVLDYLENKVDISQLRSRATTIINAGVVNTGTVYTATQQGTGYVGAMGPGASGEAKGDQNP